MTENVINCQKAVDTFNKLCIFQSCIKTD